MDPGLVNAYFPDLVFFKVEVKDDVTIYAACISSDLGGGRKNHALALVPNHLALTEKSRLADLLWICFQTRCLKGWRLPLQKWTLPSSGVRNVMFELVARGLGSSDYVAADGLPFEMTLLHNPKVRSKYQYHDRMNLVASLATYQCSIMYSLSPERGSARGDPRQNDVPPTRGGIYEPEPDAPLFLERDPSMVSGSHAVMDLDYSQPQEVPKNGRAALRSSAPSQGSEPFSPTPRLRPSPPGAGPSGMETRAAARTPQDVVSSRRRVDAATSSHQSNFGSREMTEDGFGRAPIPRGRGPPSEGGFEIF